QRHGCCHRPPGSLLRLLLSLISRARRTYTLFPYTTLFRSSAAGAARTARSRWQAGCRERCAVKTLFPGAACSPGAASAASACPRSEEHTSELQSRGQLVCRLLPETKEAARGAATLRAHGGY